MNPFTPKLDDLSDEELLEKINELENKMRTATDQLAVLTRSPRSIDPGHYRVYLSPTAVYELLVASDTEAFRALLPLLRERG